MLNTNQVNYILTHRLMCYLTHSYMLYDHMYSLFTYVTTAANQKTFSPFFAVGIPRNTSVTMEKQH